MTEESTQEQPTEEQETKGHRLEIAENVVFIGQKPFMNYVTAVVTQFDEKKQQEVTIKARGKFISRAVDVAEVSAKRFLKEQNIKIKNISIDSEEFENKEGKRVNVSTIDITLTK